MLDRGSIGARPSYQVRRIVAGGVTAGIGAVIGLGGATAWAEPVVPLPPVPVPSLSAPAAVAQPVPPAATPVEPALVPASSGTLIDFLKERNAALEPQNPHGFTALNITLPMPAGWSQVPDPNVPDAFAVIADRNGGDGLYTPNAQLVVYKLVGQFDPKEAITHGFIDSQTQANWQSTDASLADFGGFPSSVIEGTFRQNDMTLNTSRRHVIATAGPDTYLVSLSVTTAVTQVVATAPATDAIVNGFRVADPAAAPVAAPPAAAPPAPVAAAGVTGLVPATPVS